MMATRKHETGKAPKSPTTAGGWNQLLTQVIRRAEALHDPRGQVFRKAMTMGTAESTLRRYSILSETDIHREFPG